MSGLLSLLPALFCAQGVFAAYLPASMYPCKNIEGQGCKLPALGFPRERAGSSRDGDTHSFFSSLKLVMPSNIL